MSLCSFTKVITKLLVQHYGGGLLMGEIALLAEYNKKKRVFVLNLSFILFILALIIILADPITLQRLLLAGWCGTFKPHSPPSITTTSPFT
jgi:hypothetical protein